MLITIGGLHCRHVGVQNKRKFVRIVCIKMEVNSQRRKNLIVPVHQHGRHDVKFKPSIKYMQFMAETVVKSIL